MDQNDTTSNTTVNQENQDSSAKSNAGKKPRKTPEQRELELREKMQRMQARLARIEADKKAEAKKKFDKLMLRVGAKVQSLGLENVPAEVFENFLQEHAEALRQLSQKEI